MQRPILAFLLTFTFVSSAVFAADKPKTPKPTYADVAYGPHEKTKLDFWQAKGKGPRPLLVYIHGGGWIGGDKERVSSSIQDYLDKGISYASINTV